MLALLRAALTWEVLGLDVPKAVAVIEAVGQSQKVWGGAIRCGAEP